MSKFSAERARLMSAMQGKSMNERITENILRSKLVSLGYYDSSDILVEEQRSAVEEIRRHLKSASKTGGTGAGSPEFIVSTRSTPDFLIIFECKADVRFHESAGHDRPRDFAVDGVLHYAARLAKGFNVIGVAVSGQTLSELKISSFLFPKLADESKPLTNRDGHQVSNIVSLPDYIAHGTFDPSVAKSRHDDLMAFSRELHNFLRDHAKVTENEKPLIISGTLIALKNEAFAKSFDAYAPEDLQREWMRVIKQEFKKANIPNSKEDSMTQPFTSVSVHPELGKPTTKYPRGILYEIIHMLNDKVWPFISIYHDFDVVGQFYGEFLKYTGGDQRSLGIVLTPRHITELFSLLANVQKDSRVLDICAGTGGFLISAMHQMLRLAESEVERTAVKRDGLIGVEQQPTMYALAASNMILRGDGKANLYQGSCFDEAITEDIKRRKCTVGLINPPYSQSDDDLHELVFVKHMLDCIVEGGTGIAIVPMSCAISPHPKREELLRFHTLEAVMSMPDELFYPVSTVTCIMVFTANRPHEKSQKKTWFGYWKDDGYAKAKNLGRIDVSNAWPAIRTRWVEAYRNRDDELGRSVKERVTFSDEWCAEAYMETDYSTVSQEVYGRTIGRFLVHQLYGKREIV